MRSNVTLWGLIWILFGGMATAASAETPNTYCSRPLRVALFEYGVLYRSDINDGIDARLLNAMEVRSGCTFERVLLPRARIWTELQVGSLDMATAAIPTTERKGFGYLLPYMQSRNVILMRRSSASKTMKQEEFERSALQLGVVRGFRHEPHYDTMISKMAAQGRVVEASDVSDLMRMLDKGLVHAVFSQPIVYREYWSESKLKSDIVQFDWAPKDQFSVGAMILSRKSFSDAQAKQWDKLLLAMQKDGTIAKSMRKFLSPAQAADTMFRGERPSDF
jgi:polar amino acid transport system substrate-binding protein